MPPSPESVGGGDADSCGGLGLPCPCDAGADLGPLPEPPGSLEPPESSQDAELNMINVAMTAGKTDRVAFIARAFPEDLPLAN
ncbi:hypothetical protein [Actinomadura sp. NPDC049753]|uniref:hypothetical protein n=1 Tax=Actinomadura sp. NPDC049753 TaxID=3154739 RepID=UPI003412C9AF